MWGSLPRRRDGHQVRRGVSAAQRPCSLPVVPRGRAAGSPGRRGASTGSRTGQKEMRGRVLGDVGRTCLLQGPAVWGLLRALPLPSSPSCTPRPTRGIGAAAHVCRIPVCARAEERHSLASQDAGVPCGRVTCRYSRHWAPHPTHLKVRLSLVLGPLGSHLFSFEGRIWHFVSYFGIRRSFCKFQLLGCKSPDPHASP